MKFPKCAASQCKDGFQNVLHPSVKYKNKLNLIINLYQGLQTLYKKQSDCLEQFFKLKEKIEKINQK